MLGMTRKSLFRMTARTTLLLFLVGMGGQSLFLSPSSSANDQQEVRTLAVINFGNLTSRTDPGLVSAAENAVVLALLEVPEISVVSGEKVQQATAKLKLSATPSASELARLGAELGTDWVLAGRISSAEVNRSKKSLTVNLQAEVYDSATGNLIMRARAIGVAKGGESDLVSWNAAARNGGKELVQHLSECLHAKGIVISKPKSGHVRVNIGVEQMIRPGAEVLIRGADGQHVTSGIVIQVDQGQSLVKTTPPESAASVIVGDMVNVTYNPPKALALADTEPVKVKKEQNKSAVKLLAGVLLVAAIAALAGGGGGGSKGVPPGTEIGPPANLSLGAEDTNIPGWDTIGVRTTIRANVTDANGRPVKDGTPVTFTTEEAKGQILDPVVETVNGAATAIFESNAPKGNGLPEGDPASGRCAITASVKGAGGVTITKTLTIILSGDPRIVSVTASPPTTTASGSSLITAVITDINGNPVDSGKVITFDTGKGSMHPPTRITDGKATTFTSTLKNDDSQPPTPGIAVVTVQMEGTDPASTTVTFT